MLKNRYQFKRSVMAVTIGLGWVIALGLIFQSSGATAAQPPAVERQAPVPTPAADASDLKPTQDSGPVFLSAPVDTFGLDETRKGEGVSPGEQRLSPREIALRAEAVQRSQEALAALNATVLLSEDFSTASGSTPPAEWNNETIEGVDGVDVWRFDNPFNRTLMAPITAPAAIFDSNAVSDNDQPEEVTLDTPVFDASGYGYVGLRFDHHYRSEIFTKDSVSVDVFDGTEWKKDIYKSIVGSSKPEQQFLDISDHLAGVSNAQVGFRAKGDSSYYWIVDNVQIFGLVQPPTDLSIAKTGPISVTCCMFFTYNMTITNRSEVSASNVLVTDTLPALVNFVDASPGCNYIPGADHKVVCALGTVGASASEGITVQVTSPHLGMRLVNEAVVTSETPEIQLMDNYATARTTVWGGMMPANRYVDTAGLDTTICDNPDAPCRTLDFAALNAFPGDTIFVASGVYTQSARIERTVTVQGAGRDVTTLSGEDKRRVLDVSAPLHLKELTVANGRSSGKGGGLFTTQPLFLTNARFAYNYSGDQGGGFYASQTALLSATQVISNVSVDRGGGAYISSTLTMTSSLVQENRCVGKINDAGFLIQTCFGGGLYVYGNADISGSRFVENRAVHHGGGGLFNGGRTAFPATTLHNVEFIGNRTGFNGAGAYFGGDVVGDNALFMKNNAAVCGGGFSAEESVVLTNSRLIQNESWSFGGGSYFANHSQLSQVRLSDVLYEGNRTQSKGGAFFVESKVVSVDLLRTHLNNNTADKDGGGIWSNPQVPVTITDSLIQGNRTLDGAGGGAFLQGRSHLTGVSIISNTASSTIIFPSLRDDSRGGGLYQSGSLTLINSRFANNAGILGGAIFIADKNSDDQVVLTNVELSNNWAEQQGAALYVGNSSQAQIVHVTIAASKKMTTAAIYVHTGTVGITNTIVASHAVGIQQVGGSVFEDYTLFFGNDTDRTGTVGGGAHSLTGDPNFVDPVAGNYRLGSPSAARDAGMDAGIAHDLDGTARPQGTGVDIGAYEAMPASIIYLPVLER